MDAPIEFKEGAEQRLDFEPKAPSAASQVRAWLDRERLLGLSREGVALVERLIDDLGGRR